MAFLDLKAAFDSVPRQYIWEALVAKRVPIRLINAIKSVYEQPVGIVRIDGEMSEEFLMERGVKQGDSLSPLLFNIFLDEITKICKRRTNRTKMGMWKMRPVFIQTLLYADDIALIADTPEKLQQGIMEWYEELRRKGMEINIEKSKVMWISKQDRSEDELNIECDGKTLERIDTYEYLGVIISSDGRIEQEVLNRVKKATTAYYGMNSTIMGKKEISNKTKLQIYNAVMVPITLYGTESLALQDKHLSRITAVEMRCMRRMIGKTRRDRIRNERIREEVGQKRTIVNKIEERQLKWYGHVRRMGDERKTKQAFEMRVEGRSGRGRPRTTWEDGIQRIGQKHGRTMVEMRRMSEDRTGWKRWIERGYPDA